MNRVAECLICSGYDFKTITKSGYLFSGEVVQICMKCGMIFLSPRMTADELEIFYCSNRFSESYRGGDVPTEEMIRYRDERARRRLWLLTDRLKALPRGPILEIGCSSGNFLRLLKERGYEVVGIDPSRGFAEFGKEKYGLNITVGMYPKLNEFNGPFAAIAAFQVIEHCLEPRVILDAAFGHLMARGLLFLEVPDVERAIRCRRYLHPKYFQKSHLWDFRRYTISQLLYACGFEILDAIYETEAPYDKNLLLVACKKERVVKSEIPCKQGKFSLTPRKLRRLLKLKLLFGHIVQAIKSLNGRQV